MRKTKIICTLGPSTDKGDVMKQMILAGMDVARFNFSHGTHEEQKARLDKLKALRDEMQRPVAALLDTKGPEIRLRDFKDGRAQLKKGQYFTLTTRELDGDETICSITYKELPQDVKPGDSILLDDGLIGLTVDHIDETGIVCVVNNDGSVSNHKGVNVPGAKLSMPYMSAKDRDDILFGIEQGFDFIAASFVRRAADVLEIRQLLESQKCDFIKIIAKIENQEGVDNIDEILSVSDGVMVARGDMGVEIDFTEIPIIQKDIISRCYSVGKPVITATQMLDSMMVNPRPTRAEITDVANAIYDGTSAIMLSGETAAGAWPVEAVHTMGAIAERTESDINYRKRLVNRPAENHLSVAAAIAHAACTTAIDIKANAILTVTKSGETARLLAKYRSDTPVYACVMTPQVYRQLAICWGVTPLFMDYAHNTDEMIDKAVATTKAAGFIHDGDLVVITAGVPVGISGTTNMIKAHLVGDALLTGIGVGNQNVSGKVHLCRTTEEANKCKAGEVLVVTSTNNDMMAALHRCSAIIAEEPGLNSHAAIVGLTLNKPGIVGAAGALRKLHDGQDISVDSERGVINAMLK